MRKLIAFALLMVVVATVAAGCGGQTNDRLQEQRKKSVVTRSEAFAKAEAAAPQPRPSNFPLRKALAEFTQRQDMIDHPWYVYILAQTGNVVGYYVGKTVPINACNFLSSTEAVDSSENGKVILTAPSLDGMYYGGAGASSGCDAWFFFDSATDALIQIRGVQFFATDQPLRLEADPIQVTK